MTFDDLFDDYLLPILSGIIEQRIPFNKTYKDVSVTVTGKELHIKWYNHKFFDDPSGDTHFRVNTIPFNLNSVLSEIERQFNKLKAKQ